MDPGDDEVRPGVADDEAEDSIADPDCLPDVGVLLFADVARELICTDSFSTTVGWFSRCGCRTRRGLAAACTFFVCNKAALTSALLVVASSCWKPALLKRDEIDVDAVEVDVEALVVRPLSGAGRLSLDSD